MVCMIWYYASVITTIHTIYINLTNIFIYSTFILIKFIIIVSTFVIFNNSIDYILLLPLQSPISL